MEEPIELILVIRNTSDHTVYVFVPHGRADGVGLSAKEGPAPEIKDMREEPEAGLVGETKLAPGATYRKSYVLSDWLVPRQPGEYRVEASITLEVYGSSLRDTAAPPVATPVTIANEIRFTVLPALS